MNRVRKKRRSARTVEGGRTAAAGGGLKLFLTRLFPCGIFLLTFIAFFPALQNGFVPWDADRVLLDNPNYRGLGWTQLRWMFTTFHMGHYQPLSWMTLGLDYLLWGMNPLGYHLTNLLLHAANAVFFYFLAFRLLSQAMLDAIPGKIALRAGAAFAALFFAVHPLRVESVAWITERRDVLSSLFLLGSVLCYLRANSEPISGRTRLRWMIVAVVVYGLSLLSKAAGMSLPVVLLVMDIYPLGRLGGAGGWFRMEVRRVWWEKVPFLVLASAAAVIAPMAQYQAGAMRPLEQYGIFARLLQPLFGLAFYLWKTVVPVGLSPLYETPARMNLLALPFLSSVALVLALTVVFVLFRRRWPAGLAVWVCYGAILAPVLGIAQSGPQFVADRYSYLSCLGWAVLAGAGIFYLWRCWVSGRISHQIFIGVGVLSLMMLGGLVVLTWRQTEVWHDSESLWRQVLRMDPMSSIAHNNLGNVLLRRGESREAIELYRKALEIDPAYAEAHFDLATAWSQAGGLQAALEEFRAGLQVDPKNAKARYYLGLVYARRGEIKEAIDQFRESLSLAPAQSVVHFDLGTALAMQGHLDEAVDHFRQAIAIRSDFAQAHDSLGRVLAAQDRLQDAVEEFKEALRLQPQFAEAHLSLSQALAEQGKKDEAVQHYQEALRILRSRGEKMPH